MYETLKQLRQGDVICLDGILLAMDGDGTVENGDLYIAERNVGPQLLTARKIHESGFVLPSCTAYAYDIGECVKVREVT